MNSQSPTPRAGRRRQQVRRGVQIVMLMLFPATFYYFSPAVSLMGASEGIVTGSVLLFVLLFATATVCGRLFCAWICPGGALGEIVMRSRSRLVSRPWVRWIKYVIWVPWGVTLLLLFMRPGGVAGVNPLYGTDSGLSATSFPHLIAYLMVVVLFLALMLVVGRRAPCHMICWMAPFMVLGRSVGNALRLPALRLEAASDACIHCGRCTAVCPMSLPVQHMAERGRMENLDCILCAACIDTCPKQVISCGWRRPGGARRAVLRRTGSATALLFAGTFFLFSSSHLSAFSYPAPHRHRVTVAVGWESTWIVSVGYARSLDLPITADWIARLTVPPFVEGGLSGGRVETGIEALVSTAMGWGVLAEGLTGVGWSSDALGRRTSWIGSLHLATGRFTDDWHAAAEAGLRGALLTWFSHSPEAGAPFSDRFPDDPGGAPGTGPYALTALRARLGLRGGFALDRWAGGIRAGLEQSHSAIGEVGVPPIFPLPFYAMIEGGLAW